MLSIGSTAHLGADETDLGGGIDRADQTGGLDVRLEAGRRGVDDDQFVRLHILFDIRPRRDCGGGASIRREPGTIAAASSQPGGKPEALHFPLHPIAGAGTAVIAVEGRAWRKGTSSSSYLRYRESKGTPRPFRPGTSRGRLYRKVRPAPTHGFAEQRNQNTGKA